KNIKTIRFSNKLNYKKLEFFKILQQIFSVNYKLVLSYKMRIYLVFYILLLKLAV
ncbi:hypothetical protein M406DRAFT_270251, partial [Cryphonectria parasitica EP155]